MALLVSEEDSRHFFECRLAHGLTRTQLAAKVSLSERTIFDIENHKHDRFHESTLDRLCEGLGCDLMQFQYPEIRKAQFCKIIQTK